MWLLTHPTGGATIGDTSVHFTLPSENYFHSLKLLLNTSVILTDLKEDIMVLLFLEKGTKEENYIAKVFVSGK